MLNDQGFLVILSTNQSGVARGVVVEENLIKINELIIEDFKNHGVTITAAYYCPHPVDGGCECRKPNSGMLKTAAAKYSIDLKDSWMVGDRMTDVEAGRRAGCRTILLKIQATPPIDPAYVKPEIICSDILDAAKIITGQKTLDEQS